MVRQVRKLHKVTRHKEMITKIWRSFTNNCKVLTQITVKLETVLYLCPTTWEITRRYSEHKQGNLDSPGEQAVYGIHRHGRSMSYSGYFKDLYKLMTAHIICRFAKQKSNKRDIEAVWAIRHSLLNSMHVGYVPCLHTGTWFSWRLWCQLLNEEGKYSQWNWCHDPA